MLFEGVRYVIDIRWNRRKVYDAVRVNFMEPIHRRMSSKGSDEYHRESNEKEIPKIQCQGSMQSVRV